MKIVRVVHPTVEPVTLEAAKAHLGLFADEDGQDALINAFISVARESVEEYCGRYFATGTFAILLDAFPVGAIVLPPGVSAIGSVKYHDRDYVEHTLASNAYSLRADFCRLAPVGSWPAGTDVRVDFTAGDAVVPKAIEHAIKLVLGDLYENREGQFVGVNCAENKTVRALLDPHVVRLGV